MFLDIYIDLILPRSFLRRNICRKKHSQIKGVKKKQSGVSKSKQTQLTTKSDYQQYKIKGGMIQKCSDVENLDLTKATNVLPSENFEIKNETPNDLDMGKVSADWVSIRQNCKTPENEEIVAFQGETLNKCSHNHSNFLLEGCSDIQSIAPCESHDREQVKQRLYQREYVEVKREPISENVEVKREPISEDQMEPISEVPQNLLEALGLDWDSEWYDNVAETDPFMENGEMPQDILASQEHKPETSEEFPIQVVSGVFKSS